MPLASGWLAADVGPAARAVGGGPGGVQLHGRGFGQREPPAGRRRLAPSALAAVVLVAAAGALAPLDGPHQLPVARADRRMPPRRRQPPVERAFLRRRAPQVPGLGSKTPGQAAPQAQIGQRVPQREIAQETKLSKDEIGDALANLLLWTHEIRTQVVDNTRVYFLNDPAETATIDDGPRLPARKRDVPSSFSCLHGLMPGRNPEGEPEKIGGWVAA